MKKVLLWLNEHFEEMFLSIFLMGTVVSMTTHVFFRYVVKHPLVWTEELTRYLFIWFVFMGFSYGIKSDSHLRVNIIESFFPKIIPAFSIMQDIVVTAFLIYLFPAGINVMKFFVTTGQRSPGLEIPMLYIYFSLMLGLILSLFRMIQKWVLKLMESKNKSQNYMKGLEE